MPNRNPIWWLHQTIRWFFVVLLFASALGKILDMPGFYLVVESYRVLPPFSIEILAWCLTLYELTLALWLAFSSARLRERVVASAAVLGLHCIYIIWLSVALARGLDIPNCGCFGVFFPRPLTVQTLIEDSVLIVLAAALVWSASSIWRRQATTRVVTR